MKPQPTCVDTSKGHKQLLENSGLVPKYTKKKVFFHHVFTEELFSESDNFRKIGNIHSFEQQRKMAGTYKNLKLTHLLIDELMHH